MEMGFGGIFTPIQNFFAPVERGIDAGAAKVETITPAAQFAPAEFAIDTTDEPIATPGAGAGNWLSNLTGSLSKGASGMWQMALPALTSLVGGGSGGGGGGSMSGKVKAGDSTSGIGSDDDSFNSGDIIIGGSKDSFLTLALVAGIIVLVALMYKPSRGKK